MRSKWHTFSWISYVAIGALMIVAGLFILTSPVDASDFVAETGIEWTAFQSSDPLIADYLTREARLLAVSFAGLGLGAVLLGWAVLRRGSRAGWITAWFMPVALAGAAAVFLATGATALGGFYAAAALVAASVVGLGSSRAQVEPDVGRASAGVTHAGGDAVDGEQQGTIQFR